MAKKKLNPVLAPVAQPAQPQIFEATLGPQGSVVRGTAITQAQAEAKRIVGQDVVVCGPNLAANRSLAYKIEFNANGNAQMHWPHPKAGPRA